MPVASPGGRRPPDRHVRQRVRWADRRPGRDRPAARRAPRLRRRHRPLPVRAPAASPRSGTSRSRSRDTLVDRFDVKMVVVACNTAAAAALDDVDRDAAGPGHRRDRAGGARARRGHPQRARRGDRHGRHDRLGCLPASGGGDRTRRSSSPARRARASSSSSSGARRQATRSRARRTAPRAGARRRGRHAAARLHALPVPRPYDQRRDGSRRRARVARPTRPRSRCGPCSTRPVSRAGGGCGGATHRFLSSGDVAWFEELGRRLLGPELDHAEADRMGLSVTVLGCSGTYAGPGRRVQRLPRARRRHERVGRHRPGHARQPAAAHRPRRARRDRREPQPSRPLGRARRGPQRAEVRLRGRGHARVLARPRCASSSTSCAATRPSRRSGGGSSPTATRSRSATSTSRSRETDHPVETLAMRIASDGKSLLYSADTGPGWSLEALGRGADLAICEATLLAETEGSAPHLSARQAGRSAAEAEVRAARRHPLLADVRPAAARGRSGGGVRSRGRRRRAGQDLHGELRSENAESRRSCRGRAAPDHLRARLHRHGGRVRCSCRSAARGCSARRRSTRTCRGGCGAAARAG